MIDKKKEQQYWHKFFKSSPSQLSNGYVASNYYRRAILINRSLFWTIIFQIVLLHCYVAPSATQYELDVASEDNSLMYLYIANLLNLFAILFLCLRHSANNDLKKVCLDSYYSSSLVSLFFAILLFLAMPYPWLNDWTFCDRDLYRSIDFTYKYNYILIILALPRLGYCVVYLFEISKYVTPRANRVCKLYGAEPGIIYSLRSSFQDMPFLLIANIFCASVFLFSFAFRIAEADVLKIGASSSYENIVWMTVITMTTVGFGDISPRTSTGRVLGCICMSWGVLIVYVMVVVLTHTFSMDKSTSPLKQTSGRP